MNPPIVSTLHLDARKLPAQVFERIMAQCSPVLDNQTRADLAWNSFGKPHRNAAALSDVLSSYATDAGWAMPLRVARLRNQWSQIVGQVVSEHSQVARYDNGLVVIHTDSPTWTTQLTYMIPKISAAIESNIEDLPVEQIRIISPKRSYIAPRRVKNPSYDV